jgi:hypothetical protein
VTVPGLLPAVLLGPKMLLPPIHVHSLLCA